MRKNETPDNSPIVQNREVADNAAKLMLDDPILCAEFLRGYVDIDMLKDVQPEDIEDISERFLPLWQEGRDSDCVKKICKNGMSFYVIAIIEHQSNVYYDMAFKLLRYIVMVLTDYENEMEKKEKGCTKKKDFKYPPVLPIIYYEGKNEWTAVKNFKDRVAFGDTLEPFIPSFEYIVVPLEKYTKEEIIAKNDELSLIMLINKMKDSEDFKRLKEIPAEYLENLEQNTPEYLLKLIAKIVAVFLYRLNLPRKEVEAFTDQIERRNFDMMFDSFEAYDVQETRRISREEGRKEGREEGVIAGQKIGRMEGQAECVIEFLGEIGVVSEELKAQILAETDSTMLKKWVKLSVLVDSIEEFQQKMNE